MKWTNDKPTVEGWYWYRWSIERRPKVVRVRHGVVDELFQGGGVIEGYTGQWSGPIEPPTEHPH